MRKAVKEMDTLVKSVEKNNEAVALQASYGSSEASLGTAGVPREHAAAAPISDVATRKASPRAAASVQMPEWSKDEDASLIKLVREHGVGDWNGKVELLGMGRSSKSISKRWKKLSESVDLSSGLAVAAAGSNSTDSQSVGSKRRRPSKAKEDQSSAADSKPAKKATTPVPSKPKSVMMLDAWKAVRNVIDETDGRERAEIFVKLPTVEELPAYYEIIGSPIDLRTVREKIDEGKYRRWDSFERDMMLVFANARQFNMEGSQVYEDAVALEKAFKAQPAPGEGGMQTFDPSVESNEAQPAQDLTNPAPKRRVGGESNGGSNTGGKKRRR
jgi:hypothetical protein